MKKKIKKTDVRTSLLQNLDNQVEKLNTFLPVKERQILDLVNYSVPVLTHYEDRMSMAFSREIRLPFLDHRLVELALSLPNNMKMKNGWTKWIMRQTLIGKLPKEIVWRKDKKGFTTPQEKWFRNELKSEINTLFNETLLVESYGLMEKEKIKQFYQEFLHNEKIWYKEIFNIMSIEIWLRINEQYLIPHKI
jgi:asparagine synthase (glutamine-hydrolysing)